MKSASLYVDLRGLSKTTVKALAESLPLELIHNNFRFLVGVLLSIFLLVLVVVPLTGCATLRAILPGGVTASNAEWDAVVSGPSISAVATLASISSNDTKISIFSNLISAISQDPIGVFLPVVVMGETSPRFILCTEKLLPICQSFQINTAIHFAGDPIGQGILWKPTMIKQKSK